MTNTSDPRRTNRLLIDTAITRAIVAMCTLACKIFLVRTYKQVFPAIVQPVVVTVIHIVARWRVRNEPMHHNCAPFAVDLHICHCIRCIARLPNTPCVLEDAIGINIIDNGDFALRKWDKHDGHSVPSVLHYTTIIAHCVAQFNFV